MRGWRAGVRSRRTIGCALLLAAVLPIASCGRGAKSVIYSNSTYGFSIEMPSNMSAVTLGKPPANGDFSVGWKRATDSGTDALEVIVGRLGKGSVDAARNAFAATMRKVIGRSLGSLSNKVLDVKTLAIANRPAVSFTAVRQVNNQTVTSRTYYIFGEGLLFIVQLGTTSGDPSAALPGVIESFRIESS